MRRMVCFHELPTRYRSVRALLPRYPLAMHRGWASLGSRAPDSRARALGRAPALALSFESQAGAAEMVRKWPVRMWNFSGILGMNCLYRYAIYQCIISVRLLVHQGLVLSIQYTCLVRTYMLSAIAVV